MESLKIISPEFGRPEASTFCSRGVQGRLDALLAKSLFAREQICAFFIPIYDCFYSATLHVGSDQMRIKYHAYLITYLAQWFYLYNNCDITFLTMFILTHPLSTFPVGGNRSTRRKPTTFGRALTDSIFSHESVAKVKPTISEVKGACSNLTTAPLKPHESVAWRWDVAFCLLWWLRSSP
jgi:hypothetical protein